MVELIGLGAAVKSVVTSVETFGKTMDSAQAGDNAALLLRGVARHQVRRGQVLAAPGSLRAHQRFAASLHLLSPAEGGRRTAVRSGYSPQFYVRTTDVSGVLDLGAAGGSGGVAVVVSAMPGQTVQVTVALGKPVALDAGQTFAIREGGRTVGAGTVTAVLD
jgi:elongation factor Tu